MKRPTAKRLVQPEHAGIRSARRRQRVQRAAVVVSELTILIAVTGMGKFPRAAGQGSVEAPPPGLAHPLSLAPLIGSPALGFPPNPLPAPPAEVRPARPAARQLPPGPATPPDTRPGPGRSWTLTASSLTLTGIRYHGYAEQVVAGKEVKTLHFTVDKLEITDLVQRGALGNGQTMAAAARPGSVSTITEGPTDLYTEELTGTLSVAGYPLVPVTLSPDSLALPNVDVSFLTLPSVTFTDAVVRNVDLAGGTLFMPGVHIGLELTER